MTTATKNIAVSYAARSELMQSGSGANLLLALDGARGPVGVNGQVRDPALLRDALLTAVTVLGSDLRYKGKDRAAYLAYLAKQGKRATAAIWEAQKMFLDESLATDEKPGAVLPPLLTVHPDEVSLEVFSQDESAYARLSFASELFSERQVAHGTSFVDLPPTLIEQLDRLRTHQPVQLMAGVTRAPGLLGEATPFSQSLAVPHGWLRSFLQVQTAATLPAVVCDLAPIDLYNLLFALRTRKTKKSPRALRFELVPGLPPRLILEPWEIVLEGHGAPFAGKAPAVVRTFGRQRLLALARVLPYLKRARALLLGPGMPVFWVLDLGAVTLTLALTGWTENGWASAAAFDALMPSLDAQKRAESASTLLRTHGPLPAAELATKLGVSGEELRGAMKLLCLRGEVLFDVATGKYRPRALLAEPLDTTALRYGSPREAQAHRLLGDGSPGQGEVKLTKQHEIFGDSGEQSVELSGEVTDKEARRTYVTRFTLDNEGRVREAGCTCPLFKRSALREGPCEHLLALRILYSRQRAQAEALRLTPEGRKLIRAETRTLVRRESEGAETVYRVSLDHRAVRLSWGLRSSEQQRQQRLWFDTDAEARQAYFSRLDALASDGFIDAGALAG